MYEMMDGIHPSDADNVLIARAALPYAHYLSLSESAADKSLAEVVARRALQIFVLHSDRDALQAVRLSVSIASEKLSRLLSVKEGRKKKNAEERRALERETQEEMELILEQGVSMSFALTDQPNGIEFDPGMILHLASVLKSSFDFANLARTVESRRRRPENGLRCKECIEDAQYQVTLAEHHEGHFTNCRKVLSHLRSLPEIMEASYATMSDDMESEDATIAAAMGKEALDDDDIEALDDAGDFEENEEEADFDEEEEEMEVVEGWEFESQPGCTYVGEKNANGEPIFIRPKRK